MSAGLNISVTNKGVGKVTARVDTPADVVETPELMRAASRSLHVLHRNVVKHFNDGCPPSEDPKVWLPANVDGIQDRDRELRIPVNVAPRDPFDDPPAWFTDSLKRVFPANVLWHGAKKLHGGEGEAAVMVFESLTVFNNTSIAARYDWLDHWGWCGVNVDENGRGGEEILVSEPYGISEASMMIMIQFLDKLGWMFSISGVSAHYPGRTVRIEIKPRRIQ